MKTEEVKSLIKNCLAKIEIEMQDRTGRYVNTNGSSITDILMEVYGENIFKTYEVFYNEFIND